VSSIDQNVAVRLIDLLYDRMDTKDKFRQLPSRNDDPEYYEKVLQPISWIIIDEKLDCHDYWDLDEFKVCFVSASFLDQLNCQRRRTSIVSSTTQSHFTLTSTNSTERLPVSSVSAPQYSIPSIIYPVTARLRINMYSDNLSLILTWSISSSTVRLGRPMLT
jgi:hypothetical protein